jgi:hypothetical protein
MLSNWAAQLDVPIQIGRTHITEIATEMERVDWEAPYRDVPLALRAESEGAPELRGLLGLYREACNSRSEVYRFLCLYKIIEAIRARRTRLDRAAERAGNPPPARDAEVVPAREDEFVPWLNRIFHVRRTWDPMALNSIFLKEARGRDFESISVELKLLRHNVAHPLFENGGELTVNPDDLADIRKIEAWLPITKSIVRRMLKNEFPDHFLAFIGEDGVINP